ncbi:MAG: TIGR00730 family Rossman fold protein [Lachnospiraceae bacterium]|nr:TIGR00730 family Rossman fold protein [Lachnospiraceae bacterium]
MKVAVYCGVGIGNNPAYKEGAVRLGKWISNHHYTLVYGGGDSGLMGVIASEVFKAGCPVIGVVPGDVEFIKNRPQPYVTELITARNMSERKEKMLNLSDVFIALPGGIGTLDEITEVITLTKIGVFDKKCILFNQDGFYEPFRKMLQDMEKEGFIEAEAMKHVLFSSDVEEIEKFIG